MPIRADACTPTMVQHHDPFELRPQTPRRDLRRMVLGLLLAAGRPLSVAEITAEVRRCGPDLVLQSGQRPSKIVADLLRQQTKSGRVHRVGRGIYRIGTLSRSMTWRIRHWEHLRRTTLD